MGGWVYLVAQTVPFHEERHGVARSNPSVRLFSVNDRSGLPFGHTRLSYNRTATKLNVFENRKRFTFPHLVPNLGTQLIWNMSKTQPIWYKFQQPQ